MRLPEALRLIMIKADGSVLVHADAGGYKPLNWMTPPTAIEEDGDTIVVRKIKGEDRLETVVTARLTGRKLTYRLTKSFRDDARRVEPGGFPEAAKWLETLPDDAIFTVTWDSTSTSAR